MGNCWVTDALYSVFTYYTSEAPKSTYFVLFRAYPSEFPYLGNAHGSALRKVWLHQKEDDLWLDENGEVLHEPEHGWVQLRGRLQPTDSIVDG